MEDSTLFPAFEQNNIPVVLSSSNLYTPYAGVFIQSLIDHASENNYYDIIILENEISAENKRLLKRFELKYSNISIRFYDPTPILSPYRIKISLETYYSIENYYVVLAPFFFRNFKKIITVHNDTMLQTDIAHLMDENLENCCCGAVIDRWLRFFSTQGKKWSLTGETPQDYYTSIVPMRTPMNNVNTGLIVFDCDKYCGKVSLEEYLETIQEHQFLFPDQDTLNFLYEDKIKFLPPEWNGVPITNKRYQSSFDMLSEEEKQSYLKSLDNSFLIHWVGLPKPWVCPDVPYGSEWWETALRTPFVGHIISRMMVELGNRQDYYMKRYGQKVAVWDPMQQGLKRDTI